MIQPNVNTLLGGRDAVEFLRDYWQKKPLLIRNAWPGLNELFTPEELAGLACEEGVHARLVEYQSTEPRWRVRYSPFTHNDFLRLPDSDWTLLVSDCEKHLPELNALIQPFRFIPDWRIDDLMISYAVDGGSVGPHVDQYDVFLLQLAGKREWQIETLPREHPECFEHLELAILKQFNPEHRWVLQPGDMLYLPPGIPHHGIAREDCLTASIGFRTPSRADCLRDYADLLAAGFMATDRYQDGELALQESPAEISAQAIQQYKHFLQDSLSFDDDLIAEWLGKMLTTVAADEVESDYPHAVLDNTAYQHDPYARLAYIKQKDRLLLFANGTMHALQTRLLKDVRILCEYPVFQLSDFPHKDDMQWIKLLETLVAEQIIIPHEDGV